MAEVDLALGSTFRFVITQYSTKYSHARPICVSDKLAPFLPGHPITKTGGEKGISAVSAAPYGSSSVAIISWAYIKMLGGRGLTTSSQVALLNANYIAHKLQNHYSLRFKNKDGRVAHELFIDLAEFEKSAGLKVLDFAKRLQVKAFSCLNNVIFS